MTLSSYLASIGLMTGPRDKNTSHSGMDTLRRNLLGIPLFLGGEYYLYFGVALHEVFLEDCYDTYNTLDIEQQQLIDKLVATLRAHPVVMKLYHKSRREKKLYKKINGVLVAYILDIHQVKMAIGADLKTTACTTFQDCLKKAISYGYHKQRHVYKQVENLKEFYFIFISKKFPFNIFIIGDKDFKPYEAYAAREVEWLLYVYKNYGRFTVPEDLTQKENDMTDKTKQILKNVGAESKECKKLVAQVIKSKKKLIKIMNSVPKNEYSLHVDSFNKTLDSIDEQLKTAI